MQNRRLIATFHVNLIHELSNRSFFPPPFDRCLPAFIPGRATSIKEVVSSRELITRIICTRAYYSGRDAISPFYNYQLPIVRRCLSQASALDNFCNYRDVVSRVDGTIFSKNLGNYFRRDESFYILTGTTSTKRYWRLKALLKFACFRGYIGA